MIGRLRALLAPTGGPPLSEIARGPGWYPLVVLTALNVVDELDRAVLGVMAPNIRDYFGIDNTTLGAIVGLQVTLVIFASVPIGYLATRVDRARLLRWSAVAWGAVSVATFWAVRLPFFVLTRLGVGIGKAAVDPVGKSLLTDTYPPPGWNRVLAVHNAANPIGLIVGPLLVGLIGVVVAGDGSWRWAFLLLGLPTFVALLASRRLREPETQMIKSLTAATLTVSGAPQGMSFSEAVRQIVRIPTFRRQLFGIGVLGFALVGIVVFGSVLFEEEFGIGEGGRGIINGILATASLAGTLIGGRVGERLFDESPRRAVRLVGTSIAAFSILLSAAVFLPWIVAVVAVLWVGILAVSVATAPLVTALGAIAMPQLRPLMYSMLGLCIALFGGVLGGVLVGAITDLAGIRWGLASMLPFGVAGGLVMATAAATVEDDIAAVERAVTAAAGTTPVVAP